MYQQAMIWVVYALFGNVKISSKFSFVTEEKSLLVEKFLEAPDLPKQNKFWEIQK